ncbi:MAG: cell division protein ZapA [Bacteroidetes bacterium]|nr:cell division protein ZapA [Bacteroidota bacterium]
MGELLSIKVSIANRTYPLRITHMEQEKVLQAAENINKRIKEFEDNYAVKDKQDLLAMSALQFASEALGSKQDNKSNTEQESKDQIEYLTLLVDEYLAQNSNQ